MATDQVTPTALGAGAWPGTWLTMETVYWVRLRAGIVVVLAAMVMAVFLLFGLGDVAVATALAVTGFFILAHWWITSQWDILTTKDRTLTLNETGLLNLTGAFITAPGAILGLLSAFQSTPLPAAVKVGLVALVGELLASFVLFGLVAAEKPGEPDPSLVTLRRAGPLRLGPFLRLGVSPAPDVTPADVDKQMDAFRAYFFNLALWAYAFGLLCIATGRVLP